MSPLNVGVWGLGDHARRNLLPALAASPSTNLAAIATRNLDVLGEQAGLWSCDAMGSLDEMLTSAQVDAVFVATPIGCHYEDGLKVLKAGRHLWCEKAFTAEFSHAEDLITAAESQDLSVCVSCPPFYHAQFQALADLVEAGRIGAIRSISARFGFPHVDQGNSRYDPDIGGGALLDMGFYTLAVPLRLLGRPATIAGASMETESGYQIDTGGAALMRFDTGVTSSAEWGLGRDYINELTVWGETGVAIAQPAFSKPGHLVPRLTVRRQNAEEDITIAESDQMAEMISVFATAAEDPSLRQQLRDEALAQQKLLAHTRDAALAD